MTIVMSSLFASQVIGIRGIFQFTFAVSSSMLFSGDPRQSAHNFTVPFAPASIPSQSPYAARSLVCLFTDESYVCMFCRYPERVLILLVENH